MNSILNITFLLLLLTYVSEGSVIKNDPIIAKTDTLQWNHHRRLTWDDFQGPAAENSFFSAETHYVITYSYRKTSRGNMPDIKFKIHCYFEKGRSWAKSHDANPQLLSHEQAHFDIAELHTRLFRERVSKITFHPHNFEEQIQELFSTILDECSQMQEKFDRETKFGILAKEQKDWESYIHHSLSEHEHFSKFDVQSMSEQTADISK